MNSDINTNTRLFALMRYMRSELHDAELITDQDGPHIARKSLHECS